MLTLTDDEKAMLDGRHGKATQKAMDLLVRYAEALGAERFVDTKNVAGVPGSANAFLQNYYQDKGGPAGVLEGAGEPANPLAPDRLPDELGLSIIRSLTESIDYERVNDRNRLSLRLKRS